MHRSEIISIIDSAVKGPTHGHIGNAH